MSQAKSPPTSSDTPLSPGKSFEVNIDGLSSHWNSRLTGYFNASIGRIRLYWLLASLIRHQSVRTANAMAFDLFLALVPMLGLAGWAASLVVLGDSESRSASKLLMELTPAQLDGFIGQHFEALAAAHLAPFAAIAGWWLASSAFNTMIGVFEETFECEPMPWVKARLISLAFALLGMLVLGLGSAFAVAGALFTTKNLGLATGAGSAFQGLAVIVVLAVISSFLALLYRYSIRRPGRKRRVWPGALAATFLGAAASLSLGYYATNIARYALFYGGLAAIVVLLLWLWLWSTAILLGAELNVAMEDVAATRKKLQRATGRPVEIPTHTPKSEGNSEGD